MILINRNGFSMVEMMIAMGLMAIIGITLNTFLQSSNKEISQNIEDIQTKILSLGAEKVLQQDLANASAGFNYLDIDDDKGRWFYAFDKSFDCFETGCERLLTLKINQGQQVSQKSFFILRIAGLPNEKLMFNVDPQNVFDNTSYDFSGINHKVLDPDFDISKDTLESSAWDQDRILLLQSKISMIDCKNGVLRPTVDCTFNCDGGPICNSPIKRNFKMLGVVSNDKKNLNFTNITGHNDLLKKDFKPCRLAKDNTCTYLTLEDDKLDSSKKFYEDLPYLPGYDNGTYFQPVELIRYRLVKPNPGSPDKFTTLIRETATFVGGTIKFNNSFNMLQGVEKIEFLRRNVSNPTISFKIYRVSRYNNKNTSAVLPEEDIQLENQ